MNENEYVEKVKNKIINSRHNKAVVKKNLPKMRLVARMFWGADKGMLKHYIEEYNLTRDQLMNIINEWAGTEYRQDMIVDIPKDIRETIAKGHSRLFYRLIDFIENEFNMYIDYMDEGLHIIYVSEQIQISLPIIPDNVTPLFWVPQVSILPQIEKIIRVTYKLRRELKRSEEVES